MIRDEEEIEAAMLARARMEMERYIKRNKWALFVTITFRMDTLWERAKTCLKCLFKHLNRPTEKIFDKYVYMYYVIEKHDESDGVHIHALVNRVSLSLAPKLEKIVKIKRCRRDKCIRNYNGKKRAKKESYKKVFGEQIKVLKYDPDRHAHYLAMKYGAPATKDWGHMRINSRLRR